MTDMWKEEMSDLPSRKKWNTPHSPETAWDIATEMTTKERHQITAAWLAGLLMTAEEASRKANTELTMWETEHGL